MTKSREEIINHLPPHLHFKGKVKVRGHLQMATELEGSVTVQKSLTLEPNARLVGELNSHSLIIKPGATVCARVKVGSLLPRFWPFRRKSSLPRIPTP